jgi:hypothetical protein
VASRVLLRFSFRNGIIAVFAFLAIFLPFPLPKYIYHLLLGILFIEIYKKNSMEALFDNKNNVLNANLISVHSDAMLYTIQSTFGFRGRKITVIRDANPPPGQSQTLSAGAILWGEKMIEVGGVRKKISDIKRREGGVFNK